MLQIFPARITSGGLSKLAGRGGIRRAVGLRRHFLGIDQKAVRVSATDLGNCSALFQLGDGGARWRTGQFQDGHSNRLQFALGWRAMDLALHARSRSRRPPRFERAVRGECSGDAHYHRAGRAGVVEWLASAISKVFVVSRSDTIQQLSDDYAFSDPGQLPSVVLGSARRGLVVRDSSLGFAWTRPARVGGRSARETLMELEMAFIFENLLLKVNSVYFKYDHDC
jgi:hypothetical protein